jgi:hypothetical protein
MPRIHSDWLKSFVNYASIGEAPLSIYFWAGVSAIAGALRRRVWIEQHFYRWTPNFFIVIVAPPAVISKSTSVSIGMSLLREVEGINFGPDALTWQALISYLKDSYEEFTTKDGEHLSMSAVTIESSELGVLLNLEDRPLISALIDLWDGKKSFDKMTKGGGLEQLQNPWLNLIGSTTPAWIRDNLPESIVESGFLSRIIFLYAEAKRQRVAYLHRAIPANFYEVKANLISDLKEIANLSGQFTISEKAEAYGAYWYNEILPKKVESIKGSRYNAFLARKQTAAHKLAMVLSASEGDDLIIREHHLKNAIGLTDALESDLPKVFAHIGQSAGAVAGSELISIVNAYGKIEFKELFRQMYRVCSSPTEFNDLVEGAVQSGQLLMKNLSGDYWLFPVNPSLVNGAA